MPKAAAIFAFVLLIIASLSWLTLDPSPLDPSLPQQSLTGQPQETDCDDTTKDVGAAVLAESDEDQDALVNRAILVRGKCPKPATP